MDPDGDHRPGPDSSLKPALRPNVPSPTDRTRRASSMSGSSRFKAPRSLRATRAGWCFIAIIFGVGFAALNTGNNLLYLVLSLMLAFLVLSGFLSEASLRGIGIERKLPREFFAHDDNRIVLRVHNSQRRVASFAILIEDFTHEDGEGLRAAGRAFALRVGPEETLVRSYAFRPERRGELGFRGVRVSTRFPFGLFVKSREIAVPDTALVFPQIFPAAIRGNEIQTDRNHEDQAGQARRGDEMASLREFVPGDGLARVHWRRSLRAGRLLVGEREGEASGEIEVLLSLSGARPGTVFEERIARTASEIVSALDAGLRVGLRSESVRFSPASGFAHRTDMLTYLAYAQPESARPSAPTPPQHEAVQSEATALGEVR